MVKVSVVTTVYNGEEYLAEVANSITDQQFENFEWILVDDGSSDNSLGRMESITDDLDFAELYAPGRLGRPKALNFGIEKANGEYIAPQDVDDVSYPNRLSEEATFLDDHPEVGAVGGHAVIENTMRGEEYVWKPPSRYAELRNALSKYVPIVHTLAMFRKEAWRDAGGYPTADGNLPIMYREAAEKGLEDLVLWIEMATSGWELRNLESVVGKHHVHGESSWYSKSSYMSRQLTLARVQYAAIKKLNLPLRNLVYLPGRLVYSISPPLLKKGIRWLQPEVSEE
ncbi:glycosyltransferase family 2 protein [Halobacterium sp. KA-6]|uniref:glycosyltransferase family 2 protein n=1 Tax=Halobacterium sp. KA-6 TaxID=2896368 RepID=UPI001E3964BC|nr:glycosyltransferase [Halobacterium sp. KA-6]MCD2204877.1 glycosyltransferase [Halobacterium sp. KA-6]